MDVYSPSWETELTGCGGNCYTVSKYIGLSVGRPEKYFDSCCSKWSPRTSSIGITWELGRNAEPQLQTLDPLHQTGTLTRPPRWSVCLRSTDGDGQGKRNYIREGQGFTTKVFERNQKFILSSSLSPLKKSLFNFPINRIFSEETSQILSEIRGFEKNFPHIPGNICGHLVNSLNIFIPISFSVLSFHLLPLSPRYSWYFRRKHPSRCIYRTHISLCIA